MCVVWSLMFTWFKLKLAHPCVRKNRENISSVCLAGSFCSILSIHDIGLYDIKYQNRCLVLVVELQTGGYLVFVVSFSLCFLLVLCLSFCIFSSFPFFILHFCFSGILFTIFTTTYLV